MIFASGFLIAMVVGVLIAFAIPMFRLFVNMIRSRDRPDPVDQKTVYKCPPGWSAQLPERCTKIVHLTDDITGVGYEKAESECRKHGGTLAHIRHPRDIMHVALSNPLLVGTGGKVLTWVGLRQMIRPKGDDDTVYRLQNDMRNDTQHQTSDEGDQDWVWTQTGEVFTPPPEGEKGWSPVWDNSLGRRDDSYLRLQNPFFSHCAGMYIDGDGKTAKLVRFPCEKYPDAETGSFPGVERCLGAGSFSELSECLERESVFPPTHALCHRDKRLYTEDDLDETDDPDNYTVQPVVAIDVLSMDVGG